MAKDSTVDAAENECDRNKATMYEEGVAGRMNSFICPQDVLIGDRFATPETTNAAPPSHDFPFGKR